MGRFKRSSSIKSFLATDEKRKELVLQAFDTLFNQRDYAAAVEYWSSDYVQHSAHIPPGRERLIDI
jgi:predicted SnoaL-like aldol condensation-catalyzing enzyme